jgi:SAM-dependent methyltransferase
LLKYHQFRAKLGMGDLHPGGPPATTKILDWLAERNVRRVLEVGAGIGNTAARMAALGWHVTAIEPDPILFAKLQKRVGASARCESLLDHASTVPYDAIIAESVFFQMDLAQVFAHVRALLKPGGYLAFVEAVWTERITAAKSRELHENTQRLFGIAVGSPEPLTWQDWSRQLGYAGFETVHAELLPRGSAGHPPTGNWPSSILAIVRDPQLVFWMARYRMRKRLARMPAGVQESWLFLGRSLEKR